MTYPNGITLDLDFTGGSIPGGMTFARASTATDGLYTDGTGSTYNSFSTNVARFKGASGMISEAQARTNVFLNSDTPATQTISLTTTSTGQYCLWVIGTGSIAVTAGTGTATGLGTATAGTPLVFTVTGNGTFVFTLTGTLTRAQVEKGGSPTSYIPTTGTSATRAAETCTLATSTWFSNVTGTLLVQAMVINITGINGGGIVGFDDTTLNNRITIANGSSIPQYLMTAGGVSQINTTSGGTIVANTPFRAAVKYDSGAGTGRGCAVGTLMTAQTSKTIPTVTRLALPPGATANLGCTYFIQRIQVWNTAISDVDMQAATLTPPQANIAARGPGMGQVKNGVFAISANLGARALGASRSRQLLQSLVRMGARGAAFGQTRRMHISAGTPLFARGQAMSASRVFLRGLKVPAPVSVTRSNIPGFDTLLLDRDLWDMLADAYANIAVAQPPYAVAQDVSSAVRLFINELWYDKGKGIPYFESVLGRPVSLGSVKALIIQAALTVPTVTSARVFISKFEDRHLEGQVQFTTIAGQQQNVPFSV